MNDTRYHKTFCQLIDRIENDLALFYGFELFFRAYDHLLDKAQAQSNRAAVYVFHPDDETLEIGLYFEPSLQEQLVQDNPLVYLHRGNLDAYWAVVEELSHFHLIINRARRQQKTSQLELEWQAEIDKVLLSAARLYEQRKDAHYYHIARLLFEHSKIVSTQTHYKDATKYAARLWYDIISYMQGIDDPLNSPALKQLLRAKYYHPELDKIVQVLPQVA